MTGSVCQSLCSSTINKEKLTLQAKLSEAESRVSDLADQLQDLKAQLAAAESRRVPPSVHCIFTKLHCMRHDARPCLQLLELILIFRASKLHVLLTLCRVYVLRCFSALVSWLLWNLCLFATTLLA